MKPDNNIGLITYYKENYGSILQCYATKSFLESIGYRCHVLYQKYDTTQHMMLRLRNTLYHAYKSLRYKGYFFSYIAMRKSMQSEKGYLNKGALDQQNEFVQKILKPEGFTWKELCEMAKQDDYAAFIAGSDQIWNACIHIDPIYFLNFAPKEKRIAFAASFGIDMIPSYNTSAVKNGLKGFTRIAVREKTGETIVEHLCDVPTVQVADPVFLLNREQWEAFIENEKVPAVPYIFVHFLNCPNEQTINEIETLSKSLDTQIVCFSYDYQKYSKFENAIHIDGSPQAFVALIREARCVCTDSFHSTVFSIILHTNFITFQRQHLHSATQSSRITDLLKRYKLKEKYSTSGKIKEMNQPDWDMVDRIVKEDNLALKRYLIEELQNRF